MHSFADALQHVERRRPHHHHHHHHQDIDDDTTAGAASAAAAGNGHRSNINQRRGEESKLKSQIDFSDYGKCSENDCFNYHQIFLLVNLTYINFS